MYKLPTMQNVREESKKSKFKVVSLFAGGGGSSTGYRMAGGEILAINEFIPLAVRTYRANYPNTHIFEGDVRGLTGEQILTQVGLKKGELDILDGSPPCASFSTAGLVSKGWGQIKAYSDTKQRTDDLFFEFGRIVEEVQPKVFVAENVVGLTQGKSKELFFQFIEKFKESGYNVEWKILNSADYGVPQARRRVIIIGVRSDLGIIPTHPEPLFTPENYFTASDAVEYASSYPKEKQVNYPSTTKKYVYWEDTKIGDKFDKAYARATGKRGWFSCYKVNPNAPFPTITTHYDSYFHWDVNRQFSIAEVTAATSMPMDFINEGSYTKQFERLGRMVPPLMMKAVAEHIYSSVLCTIDSSDENEAKIIADEIDRQILPDVTKPQQFPLEVCEFDLLGICNGTVTQIVDSALNNYKKDEYVKVAFMGVTVCRVQIKTVEYFKDLPVYTIKFKEMDNVNN